MRLVLDASAAIHTVTKSPFEDLLRNNINQSNAVIAPDLYYAEVSSGLLKYVKADLLDIKHARERLAEASGLITKFHTVKELRYEALLEANRLNHSVYDIYYLILAKRYGAYLVSLDKRLLALARQENLRYIQFEEIDWDWE